MISDHAIKATLDINEITALSAEQQASVRKVVERAIIASVRDAVRECRDAASTCCGRDSAMMQQIHDEMKRAETALIANLSSLR